MKAVAQFRGDLPWVVIVESADGQRAVGEHAMVGDVDDRGSESEVFAEGSAGGHIKGGMRRQVVALVGADEVASGIGGACGTVDET